MPPLFSKESPDETAVRVVTVDDPVESVEFGVVGVGGSGDEEFGVVADKSDGGFAVALRSLGIVDNLLDVSLIVRDVGLTERESLPEITVVQLPYYRSRDTADVHPSAGEGFLRTEIPGIAVYAPHPRIPGRNDEVFMFFGVLPVWGVLRLVGLLPVEEPIVHLPVGHSHPSRSERGA